jgi:cytolysin-activating lysine-acyltransferase
MADNPAQKPPSNTPPHTVSHMLGEIVWLMTQSPQHKHFALADLEWMVMPALPLNQYRVFHDKNWPIGAAFWAFLSEEAEKKLAESPKSLSPADWKSGDRCWLVDIVAPFATPENRHVAAALTDLQRTVLKGVEFKFFRLDPATGVKEVLTLPSALRPQTEP